MKRVLGYNQAFIINKPIYFWDLVFIFLFVVISIGFQYNEIVFKRPQGVHVWRQTDCTSMALNYYQKDLPLLKPQMQFQFNADPTCIGEFPIMYYIVGNLYKVFGYHEYIYRLFWYLIAFIGSFCLYRLAFAILSLPFESLLIGLMLFVSPVNSFYAVSFISDPIALFFVSIALLIVYKAYNSKSYLLYYLSILVFTVAGMLKLSSVILPMALFGAFLLYTIFQKKWLHFLHAFVGCFAIGFINFTWYTYVIEFNQQINNFYFFTKTAPIWELTSDIQIELLNILYDVRLSEFYNGLMWITALIFIVVAARWKALNLWWSIFVLFSTMGFLAFIMAFFQQFRYHDYYMINILIYVPLLFVFSFNAIKDIQMPRWFISLIKIFFLFVMVRNTVMAANFVKKRYREPENEYYVSKGYFTIEPYLEQMGVGKNDLVISIPDQSPNTTLYLMNRYGWSNLYHNPMKAENIDWFKKAGAKYLIVSDESILNDSSLSIYFQQPVGKYESIFVFKL